MSWIVRSVILVSVAFLSGCLTPAQDYVNENQQGYYMVQGTIHGIEALNATKWEDLKDGFVVIVDHPGCQVNFQQGETKRTRFALAAGDRIVHSYDVDYLLSALAPNQTSDKKDPPAEAPPAEEPAAEDKAPGDQE